MSTSVISAGAWVRDQIGDAELGDARHTKRLVKVVTAIAQKPGYSLPQTMVGWGDVKAAYRLLSNEDVTYEGILGPHWEKTLKECQSGGDYLILAP